MNLNQKRQRKPISIRSLFTLAVCRKNRRKFLLLAIVFCVIWYAVDPKWIHIDRSLERGSSSPTISSSATSSSSSSSSFLDEYYNWDGDDDNDNIALSEGEGSERSDIPGSEAGDDVDNSSYVIDATPWGGKTLQVVPRREDFTALLKQLLTSTNESIEQTKPSFDRSDSTQPERPSEQLEEKQLPVFATSSTVASRKRPESINIALVIRDQDMESLRELVGSVHLNRAVNVFITVYGIKLEPSTVGEISMWENVEFKSLKRELFLDSSENSLIEETLNNPDNTLLISRYVIYLSLKRFDSVLFLKNNVNFFNASHSLNQLQRINRKQSYVLVGDSAFSIEGYHGKSSEPYRVLVRNYLHCSWGLATCSLQNREIATSLLSGQNPWSIWWNIHTAEEFNLIIGSSNSNSTLSSFFCNIQIRKDLMYAPLLFRKSPLPTMTHLHPAPLPESGRIVIALGVPCIGRGVDGNVAKISLIKNFLPNFLASIQRDEWELFEFRVYVGYDSGDPIFDSKESRSKVEASLDNILNLYFSSTGIPSQKVTISMLRVPYSNAWLTFIWNFLFIKSLSEGADYFFQVNDDLEFRTTGWASYFVYTLKLNNDFGVIGPLDPNWSCKLLTQAMVPTHTHYSIFGHFYPLEIKDWFSDFWLTKVYQNDPLFEATFCDFRFEADNLREKGSRYQVCKNPQWNELLEQGRFKVQRYHSRYINKSG